MSARRHFGLLSVPLDYFAPISKGWLMGIETKRILLVDLDDTLRESRSRLLEQAGYELDIGLDYAAAEAMCDQGLHDLAIVGVRDWPKDPVRYIEMLAKSNPDLPILLLIDIGVSVPRDVLSRHCHLEASSPKELIETVGSMLEGGVHIRKVSAARPAPTQEA